MSELEKSGIKFEYDAQQLRAHGVDWNKRISLNVKQVNSEEFLRQLFAELPVRFEIDQLTVRLQPKP